MYSIIIICQDIDEVKAADINPEFVHVQTLTKGQVFVSVKTLPRLQSVISWDKWSRGTK